ncbi:segregation and condensation protein A [Spiroplasma turonicum]|uniref:Segregation and condensation protein A n=1 Tax=Spiroplasma turonicum TaxID=216946 RepID=A0A0K1P757_9MOLU|nr:segregation/condensation protein A [Spiroplasma turonicum]AKU80120.1 segregation and condensation protein A [Spiroplasma turonicum]ALX71120.1 segregation and condensation protein A [Spiroplasma turonicum]
MEKWSTVNLENFNGPIDLLLHLIKEKELNILEVDLLVLSNQYIDYIQSLEVLNIEVASEYLVMAAYLLELKSKILIPKEVIEFDENYEEREREELINRLIEYHKIKEVTNFFKEKQDEYLKSFSKKKSIIKVTKIDDDKLPLAKNTINIDNFSKIFLNAIERNKFKNLETNTLTTTEVSPEELAKDIIEYFTDNKIKNIDLEELINLKEYSLKMLVATFLAILDLAAKKIITIEQLEEKIIIEVLM